MAICQCIKANGQQCTREVSTKIGTNHNFCWQHQNCINIKPKLMDIKEKTIETPTKTGQFKVNEPLIVGNNISILYSLFKKDDTIINKINFVHGNYNLSFNGGFRIFSHDTISPKIINNLVEQIKLHNPIENGVIYDYHEYNSVLQSLLSEPPYNISFDVQASKIFTNPKFILMKLSYYNSLKKIGLEKIINIIPNAISIDLCHVDTNQIICKEESYQVMILINNNILISYGKYSDNLYNENLLKKDTKGNYYKLDDYDSLHTKYNFITEVIETHNTDELTDALDVDIWAYFREIMMAMDIKKLRRIFPNIK